MWRVHVNEAGPLNTHGPAGNPEPVFGSCSRGNALGYYQTPTVCMETVVGLHRAREECAPGGVAQQVNSCFFVKNDERSS